MSALPLSGIRVLDLSRYLPGPYLTRVLADLGAWVAKVEGPDGDPLRQTPPSDGECGPAFVALNHGKLGLKLDLKRDSARALVLALVEQVDVVVESFRPGVLERMGLGYEALRERNPKVILCSISGFGRGALQHRAGHDLTYLARAGVLGMFGPAGEVPAVPGAQLADLAGGALPAAIGVLAALIERGRTGRGRHIDVSMTRGALALNAMELARRSADWREPRGGGLLSGGVPCYRVYRTRDDRYMALAALEPKFFAAFCARAGCPELASQGLLTGEAAQPTFTALEAIFAQRTLLEWVTLLAGSDCCCEPVRTPEEALDDPELAFDYSRSVSGAALVHPETGYPIPSRTEVPDGPSLGGDEEAVLTELAAPAELVSAARADGALGPAAGAPR